MRTEARNQGKMGRGQTIEAFINQRIRTEEAGYHLQKDNQRLGMRPTKGWVADATPANSVLFACFPSCSTPCALHESTFTTLRRVRTSARARTPAYVSPCCPAVTFWHSAHGHMPPQGPKYRTSLPHHRCRQTTRSLSIA
jgi:hypothetical protein